MARRVGQMQEIPAVMAGNACEPASLVAETGNAAMRSDPLSPDNGGVSGAAYSSASRLSACNSQVHSASAPASGSHLPQLSGASL